mgnify:CR=1 FL=1
MTNTRNGIREKRGGPSLAAFSPCHPQTEIRIASYGGEQIIRTLSIDLVNTRLCQSANRFHHQVESLVLQSLLFHIHHSNHMSTNTH